MKKGKSIINLTIGDPKDNTFEPIKSEILKEIKQLKLLHQKMYENLLIIQTITTTIIIIIIQKNYHIVILMYVACHVLHVHQI